MKKKIAAIKYLVPSIFVVIFKGVPFGLVWDCFKIIWKPLEESKGEFLDARINVYDKLKESDEKDFL